MDDLLGEDWQSAPKAKATAPINPSTFASNYSSFRASPNPSQTGTASPQNISRPPSAVNGGPKLGSKPPTPSGDAFGNLTGLKSQKAASNVSIQERQRQLIEEKRRQQEQQASLWDSLGSGTGTPEARGRSPGPLPQQSNGDSEDDILAAFNRHAPVDKSSHFPPPVLGPASGRNTPAYAQQPAPAPATAPAASAAFDDDDDPFGLGEVSRKSNGHATAPLAAPAADDDDILGDLGKPVSERPPKPPSPDAAPKEWDENIAHSRRAQKDEPQDRSLAELVDMGFAADTAKLALAETGGDLQSAVGWLLQQAHEESKQKANGESQSRRRSPPGSSRSPAARQRGEQDAMPAWMRKERESSRSNSGARRQDNGSPADGERDPGQMASEFGSKLFKSANSIWKASQKQMAKTMSEFQQERNPSQPRWMQEAASGESSRASSQPRREAKAAQQATDEAAMLDAPREVLPQRPARPTANDRQAQSPAREWDEGQAPSQRAATQPRFTQQQPGLDKRPSAKLSRQDVEDQSAQAYVSPARRKRPTPKPEPQPEPEVNLFGTAPAPAPAPSRPAASSTISKPSPAAPKPGPAVTPRPKAPPRNIPSVSPSALSTSASHRKRGGEAFKRGDYGAAHEAYTAALSPLPAAHPIAIIVLSNRALTALKTGDAKIAVSDASRALEIIGPSQGADETIELGASEGTKNMGEFFGKALMRKAEALEHMEKWPEAASVWRQAVEAGVGGSVSLRGRDRCDRAAAPKPAPKPAPVRSAAPSAGKPPPAKSLGDSLTRPALPSAASAEAVKKLRAANAAAEKADDEKFALTDAVDARLTAWKGGKADNLRALLQSLDTVLWAEAGWKKVGMSDLVMPNKVKIVYMKAIGKVHPDKVSGGEVVMAVGDVC